MTNKPKYNCIDFTFGINGVALALLNLLNEYTLTADDRTSCTPLYNGRERGICLTIRKSIDDKDFTSVIVFGENRNSDCIFVQTFTVPKLFLNPPTCSDLTEESYKTRKSFPANDLLNARNYIIDLIKNSSNT